MRVRPKSLGLSPILVALILMSCGQNTPKSNLEGSTNLDQRNTQNNPGELQNPSFDFLPHSGDILVHRVHAFSGKDSNYVYRRSDNTFEGFRVIGSYGLNCNAEIISRVNLTDSQKITLLEYFKNLKVIKLAVNIQTNTVFDGDFPNVQSYQTALDLAENKSIEFMRYDLHYIDFQNSGDFIDIVARNFKAEKGTVSWDGTKQVTTKCENSIFY